MKNRHIVIPSLLLIYLAVMTVIFAPDLIASGQYTRLATIVGSELIVITLLYFVLKKKKTLQSRREKLDRRNQSK